MFSVIIIPSLAGSMEIIAVLAIPNCLVTRPSLLSHWTNPSFLLRRLSVLKVWSGEDSVSAAASDVTPCVRHVVRHEQRVVGGDVDAGGVSSKFFCGGHLAAGPVLKDENIRGAVDGGDDDDTVWTAPGTPSSVLWAPSRCASMARSTAMRRHDVILFG